MTAIAPPGGVNHPARLGVLSVYGHRPGDSPAGHEQYCYERYAKPAGRPAESVVGG